MYKIFKHKKTVVTLNSITACLRYIGLHKTYAQVLGEGFRIEKARGL